jgi:cell division protein YceG involved in septum cleavage
MLTLAKNKQKTLSRYHTRLILLTLVAYLISGWFLYTHNFPDSLLFTRLTQTHISPSPFPISVNPVTKTISDHPQLQTFISNELASNHTLPRRAQSRLALVAKEIFAHHWYQQLASPVSRTLVIYSGQRTEEISTRFAKILNWNTEEKKQFENLLLEITPLFSNGILFPGHYLVERNSSPELVIATITNRFDTEVRSRYTPEIEAIVPLSDILIIASLIEREAYDFTDMRIISGVIWNRLFIEMPLQIDATLQYIRGSNPGERWWPVPRPADKFLDSPYNTYQNKGLPPEPIANPSIDAIVAALNPANTECLFYFHTSGGGFHCSSDYETHVSQLKEKFGL